MRVRGIKSVTNHISVKKMKGENRIWVQFCLRQFTNCHLFLFIGLRGLQTDLSYVVLFAQKRIVYLFHEIQCYIYLIIVMFLTYPNANVYAIIYSTWH